MTVLVTGMSGTGKSAVLECLAREGFRVVDTDAGGWIEDVPQPGGTVEPLWREDRIDALLAEHEASGEPLFIAGTVRNQGRFYPRFAEVVLLSAPIATMLDRVATRVDNHFGRSAAEQAKIIADTEAVVPLLRAGATVEIDTGRHALTEVAARLRALACGSRRTSG
ncbi:AAA family ATPase [Actinophytocola oryzae]|uniref:Shikimate kinase n=1 Tax=Actinophytocola oryzae TaxID=502181 RepID=A0A4V3FR20_9PSEU|nr:AAA family ATPase [Actinophytocola oryzae]TDV41871.1 shikimate kinase [Actinophytocola oryzae]